MIQRCPHGNGVTRYSVAVDAVPGKQSERALKMVQNEDGSDALYYVQGSSREILVKVPNDTAMHIFKQPDSCSDKA